MELANIKHGDYLYYTERDGDEYDYADSLIHIRNVGGVLMAHPICTNWQGEYINETVKNWGDDLPIDTHFDNKCWFPTHYMGGDPAKWMAENYPLKTKL